MDEPIDVPDAVDDDSGVDEPIVEQVPDLSFEAVALVLSGFGLPVGESLEDLTTLQSVQQVQRAMRPLYTGPIHGRFDVALVEALEGLNDG